MSDGQPEAAVTVLTDIHTHKAVYLCVMYKGRYAYVKLNEDEEIPKGDQLVVSGG